MVTIWRTQKSPWKLGKLGEIADSRAVTMGVSPFACHVHGRVRFHLPRCVPFLQRIKHITRGEAELSEEFRAAGPRLVVVNFSAKWCGPCKAIAPSIDALSDKYHDVVFLKVRGNV